MWYHEHIGGERCPIVDTWWQTETGEIMITPLPGITTTKPGSATRPFPARCRRGRRRGQRGRSGRRRLPRAATAVAGDAARDLGRPRALRGDVLEPVSRRLLPGDGARGDEDGDFWLIGRVDDVHERVRAPHLDDRGGVGARRPSRESPRPRCAAARPAHRSGDRRLRDAAGGARPVEMLDELRDHVAKMIGPIAKPANSSSPLSCRRRARGRSCGGCYATSPRKAAGRHDDARGSRSLRRDSRARGSRRPRRVISGAKVEAWVASACSPLSWRCSRSRRHLQQSRRTRTILVLETAEMSAARPASASTTRTDTASGGSGTSAAPSPTSRGRSASIFASGTRRRR